MADRKLAARTRRLARKRKRGGVRHRPTGTASITILGHTYRRSPHPIAPPTPAMARLQGAPPDTITDVVDAVPGIIDLVAAFLTPATPTTPPPRELLTDAWEGQRLSIPQLLALHRTVTPGARQQS
jgi:hypothetical protein